jgi:hypothetical protein
MLFGTPLDAQSSALSRSYYAKFGINPSGVTGDFPTVHLVAAQIYVGNERPTPRLPGRVGYSASTLRAPPLARNTAALIQALAFEQLGARRPVPC